MMRNRQLLLLAAAGVLGFGSPWLADELAGQGRLAEFWFYAIAPAVLDVVPRPLGWVAAGSVYTLQVLAVFGVTGAAVSGLRLSIRGRQVRES